MDSKAGHGLEYTVDAAEVIHNHITIMHGTFILFFLLLCKVMSIKFCKNILAYVLILVEIFHLHKLVLHNSHNNT